MVIIKRQLNLSIKPAAPARFKTATQKNYNENPNLPLPVRGGYAFPRNFYPDAVGVFRV